MRVVFPIDCGNSPRMTIVAEFSAAWAARGPDAVAEWLADGAQWMLFGTADGTSPGAARPQPPFESAHVEILTAVNHGKFASCDGYATRDARRVDFCHVFRFTGAAKTARIAEIRTYLVDGSDR